MDESARHEYIWTPVNYNFVSGLADPIDQRQSWSYLNATVWLFSSHENVYVGKTTVT